MLHLLTSGMRQRGTVRLLCGVLPLNRKTIFRVCNISLVPSILSRNKPDEEKSSRRRIRSYCTTNCELGLVLHSIAGF
jgi:hypothetical protein